jgi:hypothetical protein
MAANEKQRVTDATKLGELTVGEFKQLIKHEMDNALYSLLWELEAYLPDPDEGMELKPEVAQRLREFIDHKVTGKPLKTLEEAKTELGIDE